MEPSKAEMISNLEIEMMTDLYNKLVHVKCVLAIATIVIA